MATINPFYRFEDAIQVGSLGERGRIISLALDDLYGTINVSQAGQTLAQVISTCNGLAAQYNDDLNANIVVDCFYNTDPTIPYPVQIFIYDSVVAVQYPLLKVSLVLIIDPNSNQVTTSSAWFMGSVPANYNYSEPLCADELEAYKALTQYAETGSAIFPKTYKFDAQTGIASSLVARLRPCKYDVATGQAKRLPADTYARGARPNLQFPKLSAAGAYAIKLWNSLLPIATQPTTTLYVLYLESLKWVAPDGYYITRLFDTNIVERMQINIYSSTETFTLIVRDGNDFEFQRFYAPEFTTFDFIANFPANTSLPYQPDDFYKYGGVYYDFDFCDFNNCAYPAKESYPMPSKSGDEYQFNVQRYQSNVLPYDNVSIGLFDKDFNLVQKVGEVNVNSICSKTFRGYPNYFAYNIKSLNGGAFFKTEQNQLVDWAAINALGIVAWPTKKIAILSVDINDNNVVLAEYELYTPSSTTGQVDVTSPFTFCADLQTLLLGIGITMQYTISNYDINAPNPLQQIPNIAIDISLNECCIKGIQFMFHLVTLGQPPALDIFYYSKFDEELSTPNPNQGQSNVLIPPIKNDCYRFGLYQFENNSFGATIDFETTSIFPVSNSQFHVLIISDAPPVTSIKYMIVLPFYVVTFSDFVNYVNGIFPNSIKQNPSDPNPFFQLCGYNTQFTSNDYFFFGTYDFVTDTFVDFNFGEISGIACSYAEENISEIYSFSNLISLDNSDCFSTMIQFWAESNAIAQGFEYYNDWFQQVRLGINGGGQKPIITESTYRQSNGVTRRPQNKQDLSIDLHTDFLDFETQSALVDATRHPNFVVDGRNLFVNGDIDVATIQDFTTQSSFEDLAQVKFSALIQGFQPKNSTCVNC